MHNVMLHCNEINGVLYHVLCTKPPETEPVLLRFLRSSNVTLKGITIEGCKRNSADGFIHLDSVNHISVQNIKCFDCINEKGPSCISGSHSTVTFRDFTAIGNNGLKGGTLGLTHSRILIENSRFQRNKALMDGGAVYLLNCDSKVVNTKFTANNAGEHGGAVAVEVGHSVCPLLCPGVSFCGAVQVLQHQQVILVDCFPLPQSKSESESLPMINHVPINLLRS